MQLCHDISSKCGSRIRSLSSQFRNGVPSTATLPVRLTEFVFIILAVKSAKLRNASEIKMGVCSSKPDALGPGSLGHGQPPSDLVPWNRVRRQQTFVGHNYIEISRFSTILTAYPALLVTPQQDEMSRSVLSAAL